MKAHHHPVLGNRMWRPQQNDHLCHSPIRFFLKQINALLQYRYIAAVGIAINPPAKINTAINWYVTLWKVNSHTHWHRSTNLLFDGRRSRVVKLAKHYF